MDILLASPRGFCAGVERAVKVVYRVLDLYPKKKVFVFHEIVHNKRVLTDLRDLGVQFIEDVKDAEDGSVLIFSAHGISSAVESQARSRDIIIIDASCPLVKKVHFEGRNLEREGYALILIGHENHPEIIGTMGRLTSKVFLVNKIEDIDNLDIKEKKVGYITQTTLSVDETREIIRALENKFPDIKGPKLKDICYATQNRQNSIKRLIEYVDLVFVVGSKNSSNCKSLVKVVESSKITVHLIDSYVDIKPEYLTDIKKLGITSGASTPEVLIEEMIEFLKSNYEIGDVVYINDTEENMYFKLPAEVCNTI